MWVAGGSKAQGAARDGAVPGVAAHRADLLAALFSAVPAEAVILGKNCAAIERDGRRARAGFSDGSFSPWGTALVGADGIHSMVRRLTLADGEPVYRGYVAWRGVAAFDAGRFLGETWGRGQRFGMIPLGHGRTAWWATANKREREAGAGTQEQWKREVMKRFGDYHAPIPELIEATPVEAFLCTPIRDRVPVGGWGEGNVTLLGDAAHPTTPNLGQGACMAIEDGAVLAHALAAIPDVATALRVYERSRRQRTGYIVRESLKFGRIAQWGNPMACWWRGVLMRMAPDRKLRRQFQDLWDYDAWAAPLVMPDAGA
jgi:2-polyprenyl-6-methoxyphenol hydroxylase-like FAD-dependent oxidoreductase